jgi:hypothetical protein
MSSERMASIDIVGGFVFYRNLGGVMEYLLLEKKTEPGDWSVPKGNFSHLRIILNVLAFVYLSL